MIDFKYLATKERSAKRRRLMTTADFSSYLTTTVVESPSAGSRPIFENPTKKYTPVGAEKKEVKPEEAAQQESSFLSKYWMLFEMIFARVFKTNLSLLGKISYFFLLSN